MAQDGGPWDGRRAGSLLRVATVVRPRLRHFMEWLMIMRRLELLMCP